MANLIPSNNFEVRNEAVEKQLKEIGEHLRSVMPEGFGFVLLIASYGDGGSTFYTSSCERDSVVAMMREFIQKWEHN